MFDANTTYNKASILPAWSETGGTQAALTATTTFYFDELKYAVATATPTPTPTPTPTSTVLATFDEVTPLSFAGFDGAEGSSITNVGVPAGGSGKALKILRSGGQAWAGAKVSGLNVPLSATSTTITARVHSAAAGVPFVLKMEGPGASAEIQASTAVVAGWQTLSWTFAGGDLKTWTDIVFLPNLLTVASASPGETYYVDDIKIVSAAAPAPTPAPAPSSTPIMAAGFNAANTTTNGGVWGTYGGDGGVTSGAGGGFADSSPAAAPNYIFSYTTLSSTSPATYSYQGIFFQPPGAANVSAVGRTALNYSMGVNPEWFSASGGAKFVILISANVPGVSNSTCDPKVSAVVQATSANSVAYSTPLTAFTGIAQNCGVASVTVAQILAGAVKQISFEADGGGAALTASGLTSNTNRSVAASGVFTTTISVAAPIAFQ